MEYLSMKERCTMYIKDLKTVIFNDLKTPNVLNFPVNCTYD